MDDVFSAASKNRLTRHDLGRFEGSRLFDRLGRALCRAECLPRKELFEAWELARRVRRKFRGGRVVDMAGGHGLLAHLMLLLDGSSRAAYVVEPAVPPSSARVQEALVGDWPDLAGRVHYIPSTVGEFTVEPTDVAVSCHACGTLTDLILDAAVTASARVAVMPCCHDFTHCDAGPFTGWVDAALAIDLQRVARLQRAGYRVWTETIPANITPKNRILLGAPSDR